MLASMTEDLTQRTEAIENVLNNFTSIIASTLSTAEGRARDVGMLLSQSTEGVSKEVMDQLEQLRINAASKVAGLPESIREAQREMSEEMAQSMSDANNRFEQATKDIRSITQEIKRDLDATRDELKRGLAELPDETREATGAMRRVVSEQIDALKEAFRVVQRHGNAFDTLPAERPAQRAAAPAPRPITPPAQPAPVRQPEPPAPTGFTSPSHEEDGNNGAGRSGGWVSDLLRRASQPEDAMPQPGDAAALNPCPETSSAVLMIPIRPWPGKAIVAAKGAVSPVASTP